MKQSLALCAALIAAAGVAAEAQDKSVRSDDASTTPTSISEGEKSRARVPAFLAVARTGTPCAAQRRTPEPAGSQLNTGPDCSSSTTFLTPHGDGHDAVAPPRDSTAADLQGEAGKGSAGGMKFHWSPAIKQSLFFLGVQHGYAMTQPKTRRDLHGPFFKDYLRSVKSLHGWEDGGRFFTNYVAHPMQGSLLGFIQVQNDPRGTSRRFGRSGAYWQSRLKALAWSAAWSTQFEIGPVSQASIGNVGLHGKQTYVDLVITPTAGFALMLMEDALDEHLIRKIERNSGSFYLKITSRMILNPTRSVANLLRFKKPWHRDGGLR
ncbi:MAG: hypothetical protein LC785_02510 [Acidobacteria bacterium]|nr:hypothetical protein [Acidobacteriota bacterium]MCA1640859.1 hypothetical protein [Acidobacteriota bacterium]